MASSARWKSAQEYERGFWAGQAAAIATGAESKLEWYRWRAENLLARLKSCGAGDVGNGSAKVVEVGCGPIGVASFFPAEERVAIDPLEPFYTSNAVLSQLRNPAVKYLAGVGEALPCEDAHFDLAIIENCIDHVQDMEAVRRELARVIKPDGILYLTVNCRTRLGFVVHRVLSKLRIDRGHPHTFTAKRARRFLDGRGFQILGVEITSAWKAHRDDLTSGESRSRLKALVGVSEFVASVVARRVEGGKAAA